ncbi:MAG: VOC family protein [Pseudomonadota bacterium]
MLTQITPFILCADLDRAIGFYRDRLGFTLGFRADNYAFLKRDAAAIRLLEVEPDCDLADPARENSVYIDVQGLDAVWAEIAPALADLADARVRAPFDQSYGQREFHVHDEDCTLLFFGEAIG